MSEEQPKAFIDKVQTNTSLQEQLNADGANSVAIAKEAGFMISDDHLAKPQFEISDEDLETETGGVLNRAIAGLPMPKIKYE